MISSILKGAIGAASGLPAYVWTAIGAVGLMAVPLGVQTVKLKIAEADRADLRREIYDPETGYLVRLNTCRISVETLEEGIRIQNDAVLDLEERSERMLEDAREAADAARVEARAANARAEAFLSRPIEGGDTLSRILDVDAAVLADLEEGGS